MNSPDFDPLDREVFQKIKRPYKGRRFHNATELFDAVDDIVTRLNRDHSLIGTSHLPLVWRKIIDVGGEYFFDHVTPRSSTGSSTITPTTSTSSPSVTPKSSTNKSNSGKYSGCTSSYCGPRTRSGRVRHDELKAK